MIDGVEEFNKYVTNDGDGLDNTDYHIFNRNWELDQFTSSVPSPQQGMAPLVGFSNNGDLVSYSADGKETLIAKLDGEGDLQSAEVKSALKSLSVSLSSLASSGISINDFRNVNAYQRWKETNLRRGLKYKDQIKARWGVDLKESLLDMPEFIGGISCDVDVNQVSSTVQNEMGPLGSYAGQMTAFSKPIMLYPSIVMIMGISWLLFQLYPLRFILNLARKISSNSPRSIIIPRNLVKSVCSPFPIRNLLLFNLWHLYPILKLEKHLGTNVLGMIILVLLMKLMVSSVPTCKIFYLIVFFPLNLVLVLPLPLLITLN